MQNRPLRVGPVALSATLTTNIFTPGQAGAGVGDGNLKLYAILNHIRIVNKTATNATCSFWLGASATNLAGTEVIGIGLQVPANSYVDYYGKLFVNYGDYLVGGASAGTTLTFTAEGEIGLMNT